MYGTYHTDKNNKFKINFNLKEVARGSLKNPMFGDCSNTLRGTPNVQMQGAQKTEPRGV
jgi:hypothetical protein